MIPIENLYMMPAYAWNPLEPAGRVDIATLPVKDFPNLLARVLGSSVAHLLKRGLYMEYVATKEEVSPLRGRIDAGTSLKQGLLQRARTVCDFDEYSLDVVHNKIIKATLLNLSRCDEVAPQLRSDLSRTAFGFSAVAHVVLTPEVFRAAAVHRHTAAYTFVLDVCRMVFNETFPSQEQGRIHFTDFQRDERKMWKVFQDFVFRFCDRELPQFNVSASHVKWDQSSDAAAENLLPQMQTDVSLPSRERHVILDTKYTPNVFQEYKGKKSLHSSHLYQMSTYLEHQSAANARAGLPKPKGILLYPMARDHVDAKFTLRGHGFRVATIDLRCAWSDVHQRLVDIIANDTNLAATS